MRSAIVVLTASFLTILCGCSSEPESCRFDPECGGGFGAFCSSADDCDTDFCCTTDANCNGGMCTAPCSSDGDCPSDMRCMHDVCFFGCSSDVDCARGMSCEHDAVCEWP